MRIAVLSPHRDDAAFSLGLSIERWLRTGHRVQIVNCFTQSAYAPYSDAKTLHTNDRASFVSAVRKREDAAWNKLAGGKLQFTDLDLLDAPLRLACGIDEVASVEIRPGDRAVSRIAGAIAKLARAAETSGLALLFPLAIGEHIDHRVVHQAALEALRGRLIPTAFYEDLPYVSRPGVAEQIPKAAQASGLELEAVFAETQTTDADEIGRRVARKRRIAECYDSQIDSEEAKQIAEFSRQYGGRERLWSNEPWRMSSLPVPETQEASV